MLSRLLLVVAVSACLPPNPGPGGLYLGTQANITPRRDAEGTTDHLGRGPGDRRALRPDAVRRHEHRSTRSASTATSGRTTTAAHVIADPHNNTANRPCDRVVPRWRLRRWVGLDVRLGQRHRQGLHVHRSYVSFSVEYRIDTTLIGTQTGTSRPPTLCQWVQDHPAPTDPVWIARRDQCKRNILAAQHDALAAVRWIRLHAADYQIDPNRIAIGGFSAGAVIASQAAYAIRRRRHRLLLRGRRPVAGDVEAAGRVSARRAARTRKTVSRPPRSESATPPTFVHRVPLRRGRALRVQCARRPQPHAHEGTLHHGADVVLRRRDARRVAVQQVPGRHGSAVDDLPRTIQDLQRDARHNRGTRLPELSTRRAGARVTSL